MIDADTFKILRHMEEHRPELFVDRMEYHSLSHDIIQTQTAQRLSDYCKRPKNSGRKDGSTLYDIYKTTSIWQKETEEDNIWNERPDGLICKVWESLQGHPKIIARRQRNTDRKVASQRVARYTVVVGEEILRRNKTVAITEAEEAQKKHPLTKHWFGDTGTDG